MRRNWGIPPRRPQPKHRRGPRPGTWLALAIASVLALAWLAD